MTSDLSIPAAKSDVGADYIAPKPSLGLLALHIRRLLRQRILVRKISTLRQLIKRIVLLV